MKSKYEIKTFTEGIHNEISDIEKEKINLGLNDNVNNKTNTERNNFLETTFQPKCIFTKQNNNISFYQSSSKISFRKSTNYKSLTSLIDKKNSMNQSSTAYTSTQSFGEEQFSYNYTAMQRTSSNKSSEKNETQNEQKINKDELNTIFQKPKRAIKSYKKELGMQKSDNFNMLSFKPNAYDSNLNLNIKKKKSKINKMYKKKEVEEIFYPSKKPYSRHPSLQKREIKDKYKTHTLKYQNYSTSYIGPKNPRATSSSSKLKINQLNDFNIDKLIEIGDKYANLRKPVLPLGKRMNNNIIFYNKIKNNKNKIPHNPKIYNNYSYDVLETPIFSKYSRTNANEYNDQENKDINININKTNILKDKKRVTKKIISKNFLKNSKISYDENKEDISTNSIMKNLNFSNEIINNDSKQIIQFKKKFIKKCRKPTEFYNNLEKNNEIQNIQEIRQTHKLFKKNTNLNLNRKYKIINNDKNNIEKNLINNTRNEKQNVKNILTESKILTDDEVNYRNKLFNKKNIFENNEKLITKEKQYKKKNIIPSNNNVYFKNNKQKNVYGYNEKHNLEDIINKHTYFESVHSKMKNNNFTVDKVI